MVQGNSLGSFHLVAPVATKSCGTFFEFMYFWIALVSVERVLFCFEALFGSCPHFNTFSRCPSRKSPCAGGAGAALVVSRPDGLARAKRQPPTSPLMTSPNSSQVSPLNLWS